MNRSIFILFLVLISMISACSSQPNNETTRQALQSTDDQLKTTAPSPTISTVPLDPIETIERILVEQAKPENQTEENALLQLAKWFVETLEVDEHAFDTAQSKHFSDFTIDRAQSDLSKPMIAIDSQFAGSRLSYEVDTNGVLPDEDPLQTKFVLENDCQDVKAAHFEYCEISDQLLALALEKQQKLDLSLPDFEQNWNDFVLRLPGWMKPYLKFVENKQLLELHIQFDSNADYHIEEFLTIMPVRTIELNAWIREFEQRILPKQKKASVVYRDDTISLIAYQMHPSIYPILVKPASIESVSKYAIGLKIQRELFEPLRNQTKRIGIVQPLIRIENAPGYERLNALVATTNKNLVGIDSDAESTLSINEENYAKLPSEIQTKKSLFLAFQDVLVKSRFEEFYKQQIQSGNLYEDRNGTLFARDEFAPLGDQYRDLKIVSTNPQKNRIWVQPYFNPTDVSAPYKRELIEIALDRDQRWKIASPIWW